MLNLKSSLASAALALATTIAPAATVTVKFDNPIFGLTNDNPRFDAVKLWYPSAGSTKSINTQAGRFTGVASNPVNFNLELLVDLDLGSPVRFAMYCYDLDQSISGGSVVTYNVDFDGEVQRTREFIGAVNAELNKNRSGQDIDRYAWLRPGTALAGAAIQIGLWESLYDTGGTWSVDNSQVGTRGSFYAANLDAGTSSFLNSVFTRLNAGPGTGYAPVAADQVIVLRSGTKQDMITGDPPAEVPVPGTLALIAAAGAAALMRRRRG